MGYLIGGNLIGGNLIGRYQRACTGPIEAARPLLAETG
jgi:hypothetical protein